MVSTTQEEAKNVQGAVTEAAGDVLGTTKEQASGVVSDVGHETRRLVGQTKDQLGQQAVQQRDQAVGGLRSLGDELREMADHGSGWGAQLARHGASWTDRTAGFLDGRELSDILDDVRMMARRRPGRFLLGAAVAGVVVGRMSRAMASGAPESSSAPTGVGSGTAPATAPAAHPVRSAVDPDPAPGIPPAATPGMPPDTSPGMTPGTSPGMSPGTSPGTAPGMTPGTSYGSPEGMPPAGNGDPGVTRPREF
jgi:uncharacterized protein YjbJ (UPF0337 family)